MGVVYPAMLPGYLSFWKTQPWPQDWKRSVFIPNPKKASAKECSNYHIIALISHTSKVMLNILQARVQQYVNWELPTFNLYLEQAEEPEVKLPTSVEPSKKQKSFRKISISALLTMPKSLCQSQQTVENSSRNGSTRPPYLPLEKSVCRSRSQQLQLGHGKTDWFQIGKGVHQGCTLSPCLFNSYAHYNMLNVELNEVQAGIKIAKRNTNNLSYADDTTIMAESKGASWWRWKEKVKKLV